MSRSKESTCDPGGGMPECSASTAVAIASLSVEAAGKRAFAFQAAPPPSVRFWTYAPAVPEYRVRSAGASSRGRRRDARERSRGALAAGRPKTFETTREERVPSRADRDHPDGEIAERKPNVEREPAAAKRPVGQLARSDRDDDATGAACGDAGHEPERDLVAAQAARSPAAAARAWRSRGNSRRH